MNGTGRKPWTYAAFGVTALMAAVLVLGAVALFDSWGSPPLGGVTAASGCGPFKDAITESSEFTPWESRRSHLPELPVSKFGGELANVPATAIAKSNVLDGLSIQWGASTSDGSLYLYFLGRPIDDKMTMADFFADGGIQLAQEPTGADVNSSLVVGLLKNRSTDVQVGSFSANLTWADPLANGTRTHNLYWTDGKTTYSLIAERTPAELIDLARSIVCA